MLVEDQIDRREAEHREAADAADAGDAQQRAERGHGREDREDHRHGHLADALDTLDERSRAILEARWLSEQKATLHELADRYGVSAERIRQIEKNAMKKLKAAKKKTAKKKTAKKATAAGRAGRTATRKAATRAGVASPPSSGTSGPVAPQGLPRSTAYRYVAALKGLKECATSPKTCGR